MSESNGTSAARGASVVEYIVAALFAVPVLVGLSLGVFWLLG